LPTQFIRDGHTLALAFDVDGARAVRMVCPHDGQLPPKYKDTPQCRRHHIVDTIEGASFVVRPNCVVQANFNAQYYPMHFIHSETNYDHPFHVRQAPISVEWALVDEDVITSLFLRPYYQTRDRRGADDFVIASGGKLFTEQGDRLRVGDPEVRV
jgi:hypothetical protein